MLQLKNYNNNDVRELYRRYSTHKTFLRLKTIYQKKKLKT